MLLINSMAVSVFLATFQVMKVFLMCFGGHIYSRLQADFCLKKMMDLVKCERCVTLDSLSSGLSEGIPIHAM